MSININFTKIKFRDKEYLVVCPSENIPNASSEATLDRFNEMFTKVFKEHADKVVYFSMPVKFYGFDNIKQKQLDNED